MSEHMGGGWTHLASEGLPFRTGVLGMGAPGVGCFGQGVTMGSLPWQNGSTEHGEHCHSWWLTTALDPSKDPTLKTYP